MTVDAPENGKGYVRPQAVALERWGLGGGQSTYLRRVTEELGRPPALVQRTYLAMDIGTANGGYTYWLARLADYVHALSPILPNAAIIRRHVPHTEVHACALSDHIGELKFRTPIVDGVPYTGWATTHRQNWLRASRHTRSVRSVWSATLDSFGLEKVGFIRIDVEGSELDVEERHRPAALKTFARFPLRCITTADSSRMAGVQELSRNGNREGACDMPDHFTQQLLLYSEEWGPLRQDYEPHEVSFR
jgi:FkbM family methyltransferase